MHNNICIDISVNSFIFCMYFIFCINLNQKQWCKTNYPWVSITKMYGLFAKLWWKVFFPSLHLSKHSLICSFQPQGAQCLQYLIVFSVHINDGFMHDRQIHIPFSLVKLYHSNQHFMDLLHVFYRWKLKTARMMYNV